ncbi:Hypothetical protein R9X50_00149400 [Acrodontium crateriforme]|uniref:Diphthamide biosynthesis protein 4 n=1 Tax=Acrodontium crateriforme TaxID=150365 RepID=A0AAQ3R2V2_9PEZI|nr:Hypothetical protein R9X50_00149400 [Acrodontium crateriforme]
MLNFYDILSLEAKQHLPLIPPQEIKNAYKQALLKHHPDKATIGAGQLSVSDVTVDDISLAYKTISDPKLRADYDQAWKISQANDFTATNGRVHKTGLDTIDLDALDYDEASRTWSKGCRCGDTQGFIVSEANLEDHIEDGELTIGCKGCSLWLRILFSAEE